MQYYIVTLDKTDCSVIIVLFVGFLMQLCELPTLTYV